MNKEIIIHPYGNYNGFFSSCSIKLDYIINYFNKYKKLPNIDCSQLFYIYKIKKSDDITPEFFNYNNNINIKFINILSYDGGITHMQYKNYLNIDYNNINQFIEKYFYPSERIINIKNELLVKYNIIYSECIGVYYRGTDKSNEIKLPTFLQFEIKVKEILDKNMNMNILLVTDSEQMLDYFTNKFDKIIFIKENRVASNYVGLHMQSTNEQNYRDISYLLASFIILSKCKYYISGSSNGSLWTMFYRRNSENCFQII